MAGSAVILILGCSDSSESIGPRDASGGAESSLASDSITTTSDATERVTSSETTTSSESSSASEPTTSMTVEPTTSSVGPTTTRAAIEEDPAEEGRDFDWVVVGTNFGPVPFGATVDEMKSVLGPGYTIKYDGYRGDAFGDGWYDITLGEELLFSARADEEWPNHLVDFVTVSPRIQTSTGLRSGMALGEAADRFGKIQLSHFGGHERGSFQNFETFEPCSFQFHSPMAGIYGEPDELGIYKTEEYDRAAPIRSLLFWCLPQDLK